MLSIFCRRISFFNEEVFPVGAVCGSSIYVYTLSLSYMYTMNMYTLFPLCRKLFKAFIIILPLLGFTWVIGLFDVDGNTEALATVFLILNSLQVIHGIVCYTIFSSGRSVLNVHSRCLTACMLWFHFCRGRPFSSFLWYEVTKCGLKLSLCASSAAPANHQRLPQLTDCLHHVHLFL